MSRLDGKWEGKLDGKVAIITGTGWGVGKQIALAFARNGADLAMCDVQVEKLQQTAKECEAEGATVLAQRCDITKNEELQAFIDATINKFGKLDVLVNNAFTPQYRKPIVEFNDEDWYGSYNGTIHAQMNTMKMCLPYLKRPAGHATSSIINLVSGAGVRGEEGYAAYASAKEALRGLSRVLAREWGEYNIRVNCLAPACVTESIQGYIDGFPEEERKDIGALLHRLGFTIPALGFDGHYPKYVAPIAVFLASDDSYRMTGQTLHGDGGVMIWA